MKRVFGRLVVWSWYAAAIVLVLSAALISVGQYYFPYLGDYREQLLARVAADLPFGIEIDSLAAEWTGLAPTFHVQGLRLHAREDPAVTILESERSEIRLDILRSLVSLAPRLRRIVAEGVELDFVETADGSWRIAGVGSARAPSNPDEIAAFFLAIEEIELQHTRLVLHPSSGEIVETRGAQLQLENYRRFRRLRVGALDAGGKESLRLLVEAHGDPRRRAEFEASAYLEMNGLELAKLQPLIGKRFELPRAELDGTLWLYMEPGGRIRWQGNLEAPRLALGGAVRGRTLDAAHNLGMRLAGTWFAGSGTVWLERLALEWYGQRLSLERLRLDAQAGSGQQRTVIGAEYLDVGALAAVLDASRLLEEPWASALSDLQPYGGLANVRFALERAPGVRPDFTLRARMIDVSASPWKHAPGVRNASGYLEVRPDGGHADLATGAISLEFPRLYRNDLAFDSIVGRVGWQREPGRVDVQGERLRITDGATVLGARFDLQFRADPELDDQLSLAVSLHDADVAVRSKYIPFLVDEGLRDWLDTNISAGRVESAALAWHSIFRRPGHVGSSSLQLGLDLRDGALGFHPEWPALRDVRGRLLLDDGHLRATLDAGRVLDSTIDHAEVELTPRNRGKRLRVGAALHGDLSDGLRVIDESPLAALTGGALRNWSGSGELGVELQLDMPFGGTLDPAHASLEVRAGIDDARLLIADQNIPLEGLRGRIGYDLRQGLHSPGLDARLWGEPIGARIGEREPGTRQFALQADGRAALADVARWLGADTLDYLSGKAPFELRIEQRAEGGIAMSLDSGLLGAGSGLPQPLGKSADLELPLKVRVRPADGGTEVQVRLGDVLASHLNRDRRGRWSGEVLFGAEPGAAPGGLRIGGSIAHTDAGAWVVASQRLLGANLQRGARNRAGVRLDGLHIGTADFLGATLAGLQLDSRWEERDFVLSFAADVFDGEFRVPATADQPLALDLKRLQLRPFFPDAPLAPQQSDSGAARAESIAQQQEFASGPAQAAAGPEPADLPPVHTEPPPASPAEAEPAGAWAALRGVRIPDIDTRIAQLSLDQRNLGEWTFAVRSSEDAIELRNVSAALPGLRIRGQGDAQDARLRIGWSGEAAETSLRARMRTEDLGTLFENLGYARLVESRKGRTDVALRWPGYPGDFAMAHLSGLVDFEWKDGRLTREGSNNPLMRALGMLNFNEVLRRLKFDFKDFYEQGLGFDRFEAAIDLESGIARTREPVELQGPAARIRLSGQSDFRRQAIDADMVVTLPIGSNLPWVAALAGGLPAAAGVYVASRLFEDQFGKFSSAVYKVSGSLEEPELEFQKVFDVEEEAEVEVLPAEGASDAEAAGTGVAPAEAVPDAGQGPQAPAGLDLPAQGVEEAAPAGGGG